MDKKIIKKQERHYEHKGESSQLVTAWSLILLMNLDGWEVTQSFLRLGLVVLKWNGNTGAREDFRISRML